jgi:hypothetical protein
VRPRNTQSCLRVYFWRGECGKVFRRAKMYPLVATSGCLIAWAGAAAGRLVPKIILHVLKLRTGDAHAGRPPLSVARLRGSSP